MAGQQLESQQHMVPLDMFWRLSLEKYYALVETGILTKDDPVELLRGWLIQKRPKTPTALDDNSFAIYVIHETYWKEVARQYTSPNNTSS